MLPPFNNRMLVQRRSSCQAFPEILVERFTNSLSIFSLFAAFDLSLSFKVSLR